MEKINKKKLIKVAPEDIKLYVHLKQDCNMSVKDIYDKYYYKKYKGIYATFERKIYNWINKINNDKNILENANLNYDYKAYKSTVQVNKKGEVVQAWIKQNVDTEHYIEDIIEAIKENVEPIEHKIHNDLITENKLLEIPLFDMHFGLCSYRYYSKTRDRLISIIERNSWDEIHFIVGQDLFHNDDFEGRTTKGTIIEKVDMKKAWNDAKQFYYDLITTAFDYTNKVYIHYSKGNHDKTIGWTFVQLLKALFPKAIVDDSLKPRKCIFWKGCFIGFGHCDNKKSKTTDLFKQFVLEFPVEYAASSIREIHSGHLHHEEGADKGLMIRRLPTGNLIDEWNEEEGNIGAHKRFMVFEYEPEYLASINYV